MGYLRATVGPEELYEPSAGCEMGWRIKVAGKTSIGHVKVCSVICMCPYAVDSFNGLLTLVGVSCQDGIL